jgi:hypothetical protein
LDATGDFAIRTSPSPFRLHPEDQLVVPGLALEPDPSQNLIGLINKTVVRELVCG